MTKKKPIQRLKSAFQLNSRTAHYWLTITVLMLWGPFVFLNYLLLVLLAVPVSGAFHRGSRRWKLSCIGTCTAAVAFLLIQVGLHGSRGLVLYMDPDDFLPAPKMNPVSMLTVLLIFLPLSAACAINRIKIRKIHNRLP